MRISEGRKPPVVVVPDTGKDILRFDFINSLPHPLITRLCGDKDYMYEVESIEVETCLVRINVCGLLQTMDIMDISSIQDGDGNIHPVDVFFSDYEES